MGKRKHILCSLLVESDSVYMLGVTLDVKLTFEEHVHNVVKSQKLGKLLVYLVIDFSHQRCIGLI